MVFSVVCIGVVILASQGVCWLLGVGFVPRDCDTKVCEATHLCFDVMLVGERIKKSF